MANLLMSVTDVLSIIVGCLALTVVILITVIVNITRKKEDPRKNLEVEQPNFVEPRLNKNNELFNTIARNVTYTVGKNGQIACGQYVLRSATDKDSMNIRYNGLVKEYPNDTKFVLGEGDSICCVSDTLVIVADI